VDRQAVRMDGRSDGRPADGRTDVRMDGRTDGGKIGE
jgi:hypothetical protein